jgi:hypothetical protein
MLSGGLVVWTVEMPKRWAFQRDDATIFPKFSLKRLNFALAGIRKPSRRHEGPDGHPWHVHYQLT